MADLADLKCPGCGEIFTPVSSVQKYCGKACREKVWKERSRVPKLSSQVRASVAKGDREKEEPTPPLLAVSTGSTLLDLAISGGVIPGGGIPGGIMVEIFGPSSSGKTMLLCEIAGAVLRQSGQVMFLDPEARLNKEFARLFDFDLDRQDAQYHSPSTVVEVFEAIRKWEPERAEGVVHGVFVDSLAALTTEWEKEDKDQYGMRRAKEFSEQCRKTCRHITRERTLVVMSNQVRQNLDAGPYGQRFKSPGGESIGFYSSLRLRCNSAKKIRKKVKVAGAEHSRAIGIETEIEVFKSSIWEPYHSARVYLLFGYGVDDVRGNLVFLKQSRTATAYAVGQTELGGSLEKAVAQVEEEGLEDQLRSQVINLWGEIEGRFKMERTPKRRWDRGGNTGNREEVG